MWRWNRIFIKGAFVKSLKDILAKLVIAVLLSMVPSLAFAHALNTSAADDFADSEEVTDKDLSKMRGGFIDINGMLINITYSSVVALNGNVQSQTNLNTDQLVQAANNNNTQNIIPPTIIQNIDNNVVVQLQQQLDMTVTGASMQAGVNAAANQANFANSLAFH